MKIKNLKHRVGISEQQTSGNSFRAFFFHPDYTVGPGISPSHAFAEWRPLAGCTAGREFHPALKNQVFGFTGQSLYRFARAKYNPIREKMQEFFEKNNFTEFENLNNRVQKFKKNCKTHCNKAKTIKRPHGLY